MASEGFVTDPNLRGARLYPSGMRVLVVGGTGNISFGIVAALLRDGHDVSVFTRGQRTDDLPGELRRVVGDRRDRPAFEAMLRRERFEAVVDMISFGAEDAASLVRGLDGGVDHVVHCSTVDVYGVAPSRHPTPEDEPRRPVSAYGRGKLEAEDVLFAAAERAGFPVTVMRPAYTYGRIPLLRQLGFDPTFVDRLRAGRPIVVLDTAEHTRWQALHIDDAGVAFASCLGRASCIGKAYNVVSGEVMTWADYHRRVAEALGAPAPELVGLPLDAIVAAGGDETGIVRHNTAHDHCYDVAAVRDDIPEFRTTVAFEDGVRRNVEWMESRGLIAASTSWEDDLIASATRA